MIGAQFGGQRWHEPHRSPGEHDEGDREAEGVQKADGMAERVERRAGAERSGRERDVPRGRMVLFRLLGEPPGLRESFGLPGGPVGVRAGHR